MLAELRNRIGSAFLSTFFTSSATFCTFLEERLDGWPSIEQLLAVYTPVERLQVLSERLRAPPAIDGTQRGLNHVVEAGYVFF